MFEFAALWLFMLNTLMNTMRHEDLLGHLKRTQFYLEACMWWLSNILIIDCLFWCHSTLKRVKSDGTIIHESNASISGSGHCHNEPLSASQPDVQNGFQFPTSESDSLHENEISSACGSGVSHLRFVYACLGFLPSFIFFTDSRKKNTLRLQEFGVSKLIWDFLVTYDNLFVLQILF